MAGLSFRTSSSCVAFSTRLLRTGGLFLFGLVSNILVTWLLDNFIFRLCNILWCSAVNLPKNLMITHLELLPQGLCEEINRKLAEKQGSSEAHRMADPSSDLWEHRTLPIISSIVDSITSGCGCRGWRCVGWGGWVWWYFRQFGLRLWHWNYWRDQWQRYPGTTRWEQGIQASLPYQLRFWYTCCVPALRSCSSLSSSFGSQRPGFGTWFWWLVILNIDHVDPFGIMCNHACKHQACMSYKIL